MTDPRILDFSKPDIELPPPFREVRNGRMIYAAGDGKGGYPEESSRGGPTSVSNVEYFTNRGYTIFCYTDEDWAGNIQYLREHPELNIVLCKLTRDNSIDFPILQRLFRNSVEYIDTDDLRFYPDSRTAFEILTRGGTCIRIHQRFVLGQERNNRRALPFHKPDSGWSEPNFIFNSFDDYKFSFTKRGQVYTQHRGGKKGRRSISSSKTRKRKVPRRK